jgi:hypothetical protein
MFSSSKGFDPQTLTPFTEALRKPSASIFVQHVATGLAERIAARVVNVFLLSQEVTPSPAKSADATASPR